MKERPNQPPWLDVKTFDFSVLGVYHELSVEQQVWHFFHDYFTFTNALSDEYGLCPWHAGVNFEQREIYPRPVDENGKLPPMRLIGSLRTFKNVYQGIAVANTALAFYYDADGEPFGAISVKEKEDMERIVGELHFLRATIYFYLAKIYLPWYIPGGDNSGGQLPFYTRTAASVEEGKSSPLISTGDLYEWIKKELQTAISLMPERFNSAINPVTAEYGRAYKPAARAMLTRVLFAMHEWDEAVAQVDSIEENSQFEVDDDILRPWMRAGQLYGEKSPEVIWNFVYDEGSWMWFGGWSSLSMFSWNNMISTEGGGRLLPAGIYDPDAYGEGMTAYGHPYYLSNSSLKEFGWVQPDGTRYPYPDVFDIIKDKRFRNLVVPHQGYLSDSVMQAVATDSVHPYRVLFTQETLDMIDEYKDSNFGLFQDSINKRIKRMKTTIFISGSFLPYFSQLSVLYLLHKH